jgi:D-alanyl-D-alanine carboxypeptidase
MYMGIVANELRGADEMLGAVYGGDGPGAAVLVKKGGEVLLRKGYGMANLELGAPIEPETVFRIGSVTKQFTAAAVLMLEEQGKLALDDPIEKYVPGYPTQGHTITIEHLLNHTSGIKSYTSVPELWALVGKDHTLEELIDLFKNQPMDFAPGRRWLYNNSGYVLLGAIIEKVSGQGYAEFLQEHIFTPLGMDNTRYDSASRIIPKRASGYTKGPEGPVNAPYISMSNPHAAGALISTVDDLARWDAALDACSLISASSRARAWAPCRLIDGSDEAYGYGWVTGRWEGYEWIEHGGGINGFTCHWLKMPAEQALVVVLTNSDSPERSPEEIAVKLAGYALGRPFAAPEVVSLAAEQLAACAGTYQSGTGQAYEMKAGEDGLYVEIGGGSKLHFDPVAPLEFVDRRNVFVRVRFIKDASGDVEALEFKGRFGRGERFVRKREEG